MDLVSSPSYRTMLLFSIFAEVQVAETEQPAMHPPLNSVNYGALTNKKRARTAGIGFSLRTCIITGDMHAAGLSQPIANPEL